MNTVKDNQINFKGQDFYIGLDVHKKSWSVAIRNNGLLLKNFSADPSPVKFKRYLDQHYPGATFHVVYEVGFCGFWICRAFSQMGIDCVVVHPPDIPTAHKEKDRKADKISVPHVWSTRSVEL